MLSMIFRSGTRCCRQVSIGNATTLCNGRFAGRYGSVQQVNKALFSSGDNIVKVNDKIPFNEMRVIYVEKGSDGAESNKWKILDKVGALQLAKSMGLDLILVNENAKPPICKIENYKDMVSQQRKKEKEKKLTQKTFEMKEMQFNIGIDGHDYETKMNRVKDFLSIGHAVRVVLTHKRTKNLEKMTLDELSLKVLDSLDGFVTSVSQKSDELGRRKDLVFTPKKREAAKTSPSPSVKASASSPPPSTSTKPSTSPSNPAPVKSKPSSNGSIPANASSKPNSSNPKGKP